ncbi:MAG TPA: hypothetical protein VF668_24620 [Pyrinomonadaceae bacterium]|jgi:hypothetical protein
MTYDIVQTTFLLSIAANGAAGIKDTQTQLQGYLEASLNGGTTPIGTQYEGFFPLMNSQLAGGDWKVVWGPCLYSVDGNNPGEATNAMYVARSEALSTYVVAIAATNSKSFYDWGAEDFDMLPIYMAQWQPPTLPEMPFTLKPHGRWPVDNPPPAISAATAQGLSNLLKKLTDPSQGPVDKFLSKIVSNKQSEKQTLIFCGHSLAGALSPALALWLYSQPDKSGWKEVLVMPTAGATPGNSGFADLFNAAFRQSKSPRGNWNTNCANARDAVPHAWNRVDEIVMPADSKGFYPSLYGLICPQMGRKLYDKMRLIGGAAASGQYTNIRQSEFTPDWGYWAWTQNKDGSWQPPVWRSAPNYDDYNTALCDDSQLRDIAQSAHVDQYSRFFGVTPPPRMPTSLPVPPPKS